MKMSKQLLLAILCVFLLLLRTHAYTAAELGTVSYVNGVPCRFCVLDCEQSPILTNCKTRYYEYGCHINNYCLTVNTATAREFFSGLAMCIYQNGCELVTMDERTLLNATSEGRLELQVMDYVAQQSSMAGANMFKLQSQVYSMYDSSILAIENAWIANSNKLTEGKRRAFQLINISPGFFILQDLLQNMFKQSQWQDICNAMVLIGGQTGTSFFFEPLQSEVRTNALLASCQSFRNILDGFNFDDVLFLQEPDERSKCYERAMYLHVYRYICSLPRTFLVTARIAEQLVDDERKLMTSKLFNDFTVAALYKAPVIGSNNVLSFTYVLPTLPKMIDLFVALQSFAFQYSNITESNLSASVKQSKIAEITSALKSKAVRCDNTYCTYLCKDYAYDVGAKYCDIYDESIEIVRKKMANLCDVDAGTSFANTADLTPVQSRESTLPELKYCKAAQRAIGRTGKEACTYVALRATAKMYAPPPQTNTGGVVSATPRPTSGAWLYLSNGATLMNEPLATELNYFFSKYAACTNAPCSRATGCNIQLSDLQAMTPYFDDQIKYMLDQFNQNNPIWRSIMSTLPKMALAENVNGALVYATMNPLTFEWSGATNIGDNLDSAPVVTNIGDGKLMVVAWAVAGDEIKVRTFANNQWEPWVGLGGQAVRRPTIVAVGSRIFVFVVGTTKNLYYNMFDGQNWSGYFNMGGDCLDNPSVVSWGINKIFITVKMQVGSSNSLAYGIFDVLTNSFGGWSYIPGTMTGAASNVMLGDGRIVSFIRSSSNTMMYNIMQGGSFGSWVSLPGRTLSSNPSAVVFGPDKDKIFVFGKMSDDVIYYRIFENNTWGTTWLSLHISGNTFGSAPAAYALDPFRIVVFVRGSGGGFRYRMYNNGQWSSTWGSITGATLNGEPTVGVATL